MTPTLQRCVRWWASTDVSSANPASLGMMMAAVVVEAAAILIWRSAAHRLEMSAVAVQLLGVLLGAPVAFGRLWSQSQETSSVGSRRLWLANRLRLLANRWRALVVGGGVLITLSIGVFALGVEFRALVLIKIVAWLVIGGFVLAIWGWGAAIAPRRLRVPLPATTPVLSPIRAAEDPRTEAMLSLLAVACFVASAMLQFGALYTR